MLGYFAMLVAMTYSVELFLCVCFGLVAGHGLFNMDGPVSESVDPCCAGSQEAAAVGTDNRRIVKIVPEDEEEEERGRYRAFHL